MNPFMRELQERRSDRSPLRLKPVGDHSVEFPIGRRGRVVYLTDHDRARAENWVTRVSARA